MITNTGHLNLKIQAERVFIKDGLFSEEIPSIVDFSRQPYWPNYYRRALRSQSQIGKKVFDLWSQTQFGRIFSVQEWALRPFVKKCVIKAASTNITWKEVKRALRRTLRLAETNQTQSISNMRCFLDEIHSHFSPWNRFIPKVEPLGFLKQKLHMDFEVQSIINRRHELLGFLPPVQPVSEKPIVLELPKTESRGRSREFVEKAAASIKSRSRSKTPTFELTDDLVVLPPLPENKQSKDYYPFWIGILNDFSSEEFQLEFLGHQFAKGAVTSLYHFDFFKYAQKLPIPENWTKSDEFLMNSLLEFGQRDATRRVDLSSFHQIRYFYLYRPDIFVAICKNLQPYLKIPSFEGEIVPTVKPELSSKTVNKIQLVARTEAERSLKLQQLLKDAKGKPLIPESQRVALKEFTRFPSDLIVELLDFMALGYSFEDYQTFKRNQ